MNCKNTINLLRNVSLRPRKLSLLLSVAGALTLGLVGVAQAQPASVGTIEGRVSNASTHTYLSNAIVTVANTSLEALTNDFGEYQIRNVPAGSVSLKVTFTGQDPLIGTVTVTPGQTVARDFQFSGAANGRDGALVLDPMTVEARRFKTAQ